MPSALPSLPSGWITINMQQATEMAAAAGVSRRTLYNWMRHGHIRYADSPQGRRVVKADLATQLSLPYQRGRSRVDVIREQRAPGTPGVADAQE